MKKVLDINKNNVNEENLNKLSNFLKRLNEQGLNDELKKEGKKLIKNINPIELSLAEQKLIDEGMNPQNLRSFCDIHMEILKDELLRLEKGVKEGHILHLLLKEHTEISELLDNLEALNTKVSSLNSISLEIANEVKHFGELLLDAEPHHMREEDVLFPVLESKGITGPTRIMKMEHEDLRILKRDLKSLGENFKNYTVSEFKEILNSISSKLIFDLSEHIVKENYILYPTALDTLTDEEFNNMLEKSKEIGFCSFSK